MLSIIIFVIIIYLSNVGSTQNEGDIRNGGKLKEIATNKVVKGKTDMAAVVITKSKAKTMSSK